MTSLMKHLIPFVIIVALLFCPNVSCLDTDTINSTLVLQDSDSIRSSGNVFVLGFFSPNDTTHRYVGIWYFVSPEVVLWVANRDRPINDSSGSVSLSSDGNIVVMNGRQQIVWSTNNNISLPTSNRTAQLLDTGNFVLQDGTSGSTVWESFAHPTDTFLPGIRPTYNTRTRARVSFNSWRTVQDPGQGNFTFGISAVIVPQVYIWERNSTVPRWRSGPWNGRIFTAVWPRTSVYFDGFTVVNDPNGDVYVSWVIPLLGRMTVNSSGFVENRLWNDSTRVWDLVWPAPATYCDQFNHCGTFAFCYVENSPICRCLVGYEPRNNGEWSRGVWNGGCVRRREFLCERNGTEQDRFSLVTFAKVPEYMQRTAGVESDCKSICLRNCSCLAYAYDLGIGCMYWSGTLQDIQQFSDGIAGGMSLYVRRPYSEQDSTRRTLIIILSTIGSVIAASICLLGAWWICKRKTDETEPESLLDPSEPAGRVEMDRIAIEELPLYSFEVLANATNNFDEANKLGMGGFGPVYKGSTGDNNKIAVKRLSALSGQGIEEFMNEVVVISKLQHRNLVKLLGCCVDKQEKMLVYEYVENKSLDVFLFDKKQNVLDWKKRFNIIEGIGRGLLYLHRDSRLKIIHRDLKPSNVLLDEEWNPKISDFGMARIFGGNQDQANTAKVVGTYGYMAPEYVIGGRFSEKSDIFSFGVVILEIISGKKNTSFYNDAKSLSLLEHTWRLWNDDKAVELVDKRILDPSTRGEIMRCMHIGLLCVQEFHGNRPTTSTVVSLLSSEIVDLPIFGRPGFTEGWHIGSTTSSSQSTNRVTVTTLEGR